MLINEPLVIFQPAAALTTTAVQCLLHAALVEESVIMTATVRTVMAVDLKIVKTFIPLYQRKVHVVLVSIVNFFYSMILIIWDLKHS